MNQVNFQKKDSKICGILLPSLNRKLCGKDYSSFAHAFESVQIEEQHLGEDERPCMEKTRSNIENEESWLGRTLRNQNKRFQGS